MKDLFESDDDIQVNVGNDVFLHMKAARLKFKLTKEKVGFHFSQKRVDPFDVLNKELKTEQVVSGYSEPVDNSLGKLFALALSARLTSTPQSALHFQI